MKPTKPIQSTLAPAPKRLSRRTLLRGAAGVGLALPLLDAMRPRAANAQAATTPRRIIFAFQPNGDEIATRFTTVGETNFVFGEFLAPLEPYRQDLLVLNKLDKKFGKLPAGAVADNHEQGGSSLAPWPSGEGSYPIGGATTTIGFVLGPSADRSIGDMVLAKNPSIPYRHLVYRVGGKRNDIWNLHSHAGPVGTQNPIPPETDPYAAYARIFMFNSTDAAAQAAIQARAFHHPDPPRDLVAMASGKAAWRHGFAFLGKRQDRRNPGGFRTAQMRGIVPEIALGTFIGAIGTDAGLGDVEVDLHDPVLAPDQLDQQREPGFQPLAEEAAALPEEGVLGGLLADRRSAADALAAFIVLHGLLDRGEIETVMAAEVPVLTANGGPRHVRIHLG